VDARYVVEILDGIRAAFERAQTGLDHAESGQTVAIDDL
jgi:hypothetical protein